MSEEHRAGLIDLAREVGRLAGTQDQLLVRIEELFGVVKEARDDISQVKESIPEGHKEKHSILDKKLEAANDFAKFWHGMNCMLSMAVSTHTRKTITLLLVIAILYIAGARETAGTLLNKLIASFGGS